MAEIVFKKPHALTDVPFHYCPGCTHGIVHRLVAEVIDELGVVHSLSLLMSAFALPIPPEHITMFLHRPTERSATNSDCSEFRNFGVWLQPRYIFGAG